jgi:bifunctional DNA-binding transcriptional regulator/antitoxin component of YhaV-PrlF toxin-antitoxin module
MEQGIPSGVWNCRIDGSGRIVIPHLVRSEKSLKIGDEVSICKIGDDFIIRRKDEMMGHLLDLFRVDIPDGVSLVDELLAERRAEAAREEEGH